MAKYAVCVWTGAAIRCVDGQLPNNLRCALAAVYALPWPPNSIRCYLRLPNDVSHDNKFCIQRPKKQLSIRMRTRTRACADKALAMQAQAGDWQSGRRIHVRAIRVWWISACLFVRMQMCKHARLYARFCPCVSASGCMDWRFYGRIGAFDRRLI